MVVSNLYKFNNAIGGVKHWSYSFQEPQFHLLGRGWLGFRLIKIKNEINGDLTTKIFHHKEIVEFENDNNIGKAIDFPFKDVPVIEIRNRYDHQGKLRFISRIDRFFKTRLTNDNKTYFPYVEELRNGVGYFDKKWTRSILEETSNVYDDFGNLTSSEQTISSGIPKGPLNYKFSQELYPLFQIDSAGFFVRKVYNTVNNVRDWLIGKVYDANITYRSSLSNYLLKSNFTNTGNWPLNWFPLTSKLPIGGESLINYHLRYYPNGLLKKYEIGHNRTPVKKITRDFEYDQFGNIQKIHTSGVFNNMDEEHTRSTLYSYETIDYTYPVTIQNALNQILHLNFDNKFGVLKWLTDPNGHTTNYLLDGFGKIKRINYPDKHYIKHDWSVPTDDIHSKVMLKISTPSGEKSFRYDRIGRQIRSSKLGFNGELKSTGINYDHLGRIKNVSLQSDARKGNPRLKYNFTYDPLDRITKVRNGSNHTKVVYDGPLMTITDALGNTNSYFFNSMKQISTVVDAGGGVTKYLYNGKGSMWHILSENSNVAMDIFHDGLDRIHRLSDGSFGSLTFDFNAFGERISTTDAIGNSIDYHYDKLGRFLKEVDQLGNTGVEFVWDKSKNGIGFLSKAYGSNHKHGDIYRYDRRGRVKKLESKRIWDLPTDIPQVALNWKYDKEGRVHKFKFPKISKIPRQKIKYRWNQYGFLSKIKSRDFRQKILDMDLQGHILSERLGNKLEVVRSYDSWSDKLVSMEYKLAKDFSKKVSYKYYRNGNIKSIFENDVVVGSFRYDALNRLSNYFDSSFGHGNLTYLRNGNVASKTGVGNYSYHGSFVNAVVDAGGSGFGYNLTGKQDRRPSYTLDYSNFNRPIEIQNTITNIKTTYEYDGFGKIAMRKDDDTGLINFHRLFEIEVTDPKKATETIQYRFYIPGLDNIIGQKLYVFSGGRRDQRNYYIHLDRLNSVDFVTNEQAEIVGNRDYDIYGNLKSNLSTYVSSVNMGYTGGQDELDFGLVRMGERMYDPTVGRFLSPDPVIQYPYMPHSLDRYSYVFNNPANFIDPTGRQGEDVDDTSDLSTIPGDEDDYNATEDYDFHGGEGESPSNQSTDNDKFAKDQTGTAETDLDSQIDQVPNRTLELPEPTINISYGKKARPEVVSDFTTGLVEDAGATSDNPNVHISSTLRTAKDQARAMEKNVRRTGPEKQKSEYKKAGRRVIDVYIQNQGRPRSEIRKAMENKINEIGPSKVSKHSGNPYLLNVIDIPIWRLRNPKAFRRAIQSHINVHLLRENGVFHLEIIQPPMVDFIVD